MCYDLAAPVDDQRRQIHYWLRYLNSFFDKGSSDSDQTAKWKVLIVGMRADLQRGEPIATTDNWQRSFPTLPIHDKNFQVSAKNERTLGELFETMQLQCKKVMDLAEMTPKYFRELLHYMRSIEAPANIIHEEKIVGVRWSKDLVECALKYLHDVGEIVRFTDGRICTRPSVIPKIMAKFISPEEVRNQLLRDGNGKLLLFKTDIDSIFSVTNKESKRYL